MHVETLGSGPRVLLVHGSVANGRATWGAVLEPLAARFELVLLNRPGFPPHAEPEAVDFDDHARLVAELLEPPAHLVGHSYGGVISLLAAGLRLGAVRSLAVLEPPAFGVARGQPAVEETIAASVELWETGPRDPEAFLRAFLGLVGSRLPGKHPSPALLQGARTLMLERPPWEAEIPLRALRAAPFPKLVVSGDHDAAYEAVADVLARRMRAERRVLAGAGHSVPRAPGCAELLADFLARAS